MVKSRERVEGKFIFSIRLSVEWKEIAHQPVSDEMDSSNVSCQQKFKSIPKHFDEKCFIKNGFFDEKKFL